MAYATTDMIKPTEEARFWSKVDRRGPDECWPWTGERIRKGYGRFYASATKMMATHAALMLAGTPKPYADAVAMHACDNPPCCNPAHLRWGTVAENNADRDAKGRAAPQIGTANRNAKLTADDVLAIYFDRRSHIAVANHYGIASNTVCDIRRFRSWRHITAGLPPIWLLPAPPEQGG